MGVIMLAVIANVIIFVANLVCMNHITKEVYLSLERFAKFKCLSDEFKKYNTPKNKYLGKFPLYFIFAIPVINFITLFISCFDYDNMVKDVQKTTVDEFMAWIEDRK